MSIAEILEELPRLTAQERQMLMNQLHLDQEEDAAIEEGIRSFDQGPGVSWDELYAEFKRKYGWK